MGRGTPNDSPKDETDRIRYSDMAPWIMVLIGLVLVGCATWFSSKSRAYHAAYEYYERSHHQYEIAETQERECRSRSTVEEALDCYEVAKKAARDHHREEQDLNAQRQMADWAFYMTIVTFGVGMATVSVAAIAAFWARGAILKMSETNAIMRAEQRPWLTLRREIDCYFSVTENDPTSPRGKLFKFNTYLRWSFKLKNIGKSPAFGG